MSRSIPAFPSRIRGIIRFAGYLLLACLVLVALVFTVLRLAVALVPEFRDDITGWVSDAVGQEIQVQQLGARLRGAKLTLVLQDVRVGEVDRPGLELDEVQVQLNVRESLRYRDLRLGAVIVRGLELTAERQRDGRYNLVGIGPAQVELPPLDLLDDLLLQRFTVVLEGASLRLHDRARDEWHAFPELEGRLLNLEDGRRQLSGRLQGPEHWFSQLAFIAEWGGSGIRSIAEAPVDYYLTIRQLQPRAVEEAVIPAGHVPYVNGSGNLEVWGRMDAGIPGLGGHDRPLELAGSVQLRASDGVLLLPRLFRGPIPQDQLEVIARWHLGPDGWQVDVDQARASNEDGDAAARVRVARRNDEARPFLDIRAHVDGRPGNAANTGRYLPAAIMPPPLVDWLDMAIAGGTAPSADVIFFGHAGDFPFEDNQGVFRVEADARDVTLAYWPEWPAVQGLDGRLVFNAREMRILADAGRIGGARAQRAEARIPVLGKTPLTISGGFLGEGDALLGFLRDMPLTGEGVDQVLERLRLDGEHRVDLALMIPFHGLPLELDGTVTLQDGALHWPERALTVDDLQGEVRFDQRGIRSEAVRGSLAGAPLRMDTETWMEGDSSRIRLTAELDDAPMRVVEEQIPALDFLQGSSNLTIQAEFPGFIGDPPAPLVGLRFGSSLRGAESALPEPLRKSADEAWPFELALGIGSGGVGPIRFSAADRLSGVLLLQDDGSPERLGLRLGGGNATLPPDPGLFISGDLEQASLEEWLRYLAQGEEADQDLPLRQLDLAAQSLLIHGVAFPDVALRLTRQADVWDLRLSGRSVSGAGSWTAQRGGQLQVELDHLRVPALPMRVAEGAGDRDSTPPDPALWPDQWPFAALRINRLYYQDAELGRVVLDAEPVDGGYRLRGLSLEGGHFTLEADGAWDADQQRGETRLSYRLRSDNLGNTAAAFGRSGVIRGGNGRASGDLRWTGVPWDYGLDLLEGDLRATLRDGRLLQVEPGAGRLLGLFSVALLPRRLMMNFSDVVDEGFEFDVIRADLHLDRGVVEPRQLMMRGPAAQVEVSGRLDLLQGKYDQTVLVAPRTSGTLPLIGGLLGGPPVAAALLVTQQVFRDTLDRAVGMQYRVTGPFNEPNIERIRRRPQDGDDELDPLQVPGS